MTESAVTICDDRPPEYNTYTIETDEQRVEGYGGTVDTDEPDDVAGDYEPPLEGGPPDVETLDQEAGY